MNKRGIIILSTLFALFALSFGVLGVRALTLGPDPAQPTDAQLAARTVAANQLERQIAAARAETPPALPPVPEQVAQRNAVPAQTQAPAQQARGGEYYDEGEEYEGEHGEERETEYGGDDHEYEGDHDDD